MYKEMFFYMDCLCTYDAYLYEMNVCFFPLHCLSSCVCVRPCVLTDFADNGFETHLDWRLAETSPQATSLLKVNITIAWNSKTIV